MMAPLNSIISMRIQYPVHYSGRGECCVRFHISAGELLRSGCFGEVGKGEKIAVGRSWSKEASRYPTRTGGVYLVSEITRVPLTEKAGDGLFVRYKGGFYPPDKHELGACIERLRAGGP